MINLGRGITFEVRDQESQKYNVIGATPKYSIKKLLWNDDHEICEANQFQERVVKLNHNGIKIGKLTIKIKWQYDDEDMLFKSFFTPE